MKKYTLFVACFIFCMQNFYGQSVNDSIRSSRNLNEVVVTADKTSLQNKTQALDIVSADVEYLSVNRGSNLMSSLEKIPGVKSIQIGQGFSKPMIRGLAFNRVAVLQNGIKQQGQQWGGDHGLEIDQYDMERIDIYKGASSLQYGSDAIAGVIVIQPMSLKKNDGLSGLALINGASNNRLFGGSVNTHYQKNEKYIEGRATYQNFEAYHVPTKSFKYLGQAYPIYNRILKNTAGRETDLALRAGIIKSNHSSNILVSNVYAKTGFFAGAHGTPHEEDLQDEGKYRAIGMPYQSVNHLKVAFNQVVKLNSQHEINFDLGYQNNNRKEFAEPHSHGGEEFPDSNLELALKLQTGTLNAAWINQLSSNNKLTIGVNSEFQDNDIGGFSFLLPQFEQVIAGVYAINRFRLSDKMVLTSGVRYDYARLHVHEFVEEHHHHEVGEHEHEDEELKAEKLKKDMGDVSFGIGVAYQINPIWSMKANLGKSFRMVTASELSSNGVHHGAFRHEVGDSKLKAETSYQLDYSIDFQKELDGFINKVEVGTSVFGNYFPNFIFLNPTGELSELHDASEVYKYEQAKSLRAGGEVLLKIDFASVLRLQTAADYIYAKNLDSKTAVPFTPPFSLLNELSVKLDKIAWFEKNTIAVSHRFNAAQHRVASHEMSTPNSHVFDASFVLGVPMKNSDAKVILQVQNIFDKKYYNHLSFYRYLSIPEIGRSFRLSIQVPFG